MYGDEELAVLFTSNTTEHSRVYTDQTKGKVTCVYFTRIELVVKLVFEVKNAVDVLSPHIYNDRFGPSSPLLQNLARENDLLAWFILAGLFSIS